MKTIILLCLAVLLCGCSKDLTPPNHYINATKLCEAHDGLVSGHYFPYNGGTVYEVNCRDGITIRASAQDSKKELTTMYD
jgi:hypothetical protein